MLENDTMQKYYSVPNEVINKRNICTWLSMRLSSVPNSCSRDA